jgi:hypothetical protein
MFNSSSKDLKNKSFFLDVFKDFQAEMHIPENLSSDLPATKNFLDNLVAFKACHVEDRKAFLEAMTNLEKSIHAYKNAMNEQPIATLLDTSADGFKELNQLGQQFLDCKIKLYQKIDQEFNLKHLDTEVLGRFTEGKRLSGMDYALEFRTIFQDIQHDMKDLGFDLSSLDISKRNDRESLKEMLIDFQKHKPQENFVYEKLMNLIKLMEEPHQAAFRKADDYLEKEWNKLTGKALDEVKEIKTVFDRFNRLSDALQGLIMAPLKLVAGIAEIGLGFVLQLQTHHATMGVGLVLDSVNTLLKAGCDFVQAFTPEEHAVKTKKVM